MALRIGACEMSTQRAMLRAVGVDQKRNVIGLQSAWACRDQQAQRMCADQRVLNLQPIFTKVRWLVHRVHITFFTRPQVLSADQMRRSSRNRSIGADDLIELMR